MSNDQPTTDIEPHTERDRVGNALAVTGTKPTRGTSLEVAAALWPVAHRIARTPMVPKGLQGSPEATLAAMLTGHELGLPMMASLRSIHVIEGRAALSAEGMRALILAHGHDIWIEESTSQKVTVGGSREGSERVSRITWTMEDAKRAGLAGKNVWRSYPRAMLTARATAELARAMFADVIGGLSHSVEELEDLGDAVIPATVERGAPEVIQAAEPVSNAPAEGVVITPPTPAPATPPPAVDDDDVIEAEVVEAPTPVPPPTPPPAEPAASPAPVAPDEREDPGVDDHTPEPGDGHTDGPRMTGPQMVAMRFADRNITDRGERLAITSAIIGRAITSGNDLNHEDTGLVLTVLETADEETLRAMLEPDIAEDVPDTPADAAPVPAAGNLPAPPEQLTEDQWRALLKSRKVKVAELIKYARSIDVTNVAALADFVGHEHAATFIEFIEAVGAERSSR